MNVLKHISNRAVLLQLKAKNQKPIANSPIIAKIFRDCDNINIIITSNYKNKHLSTLRILDYFFASNLAKFSY